MKAIVEDGNVIALEFSGRKFPLKKPFPIEQYKEIEKAAKTFTEYVDLDGLSGFEQNNDQTDYGEFDERDLVEYLQENTDVQNAFFRTLAKNNEKYIKMVDLLKEMRKNTGRNLVPQSISGMAAGLTKKAKNWYKKEAIYEQEWSDILGMNSYRILPKYLNVVKKYYDMK